MTAIATSQTYIIYGTARKCIITYALTTLYQGQGF